MNSEIKAKALSRHCLCNLRQHDLIHAMYPRDVPDWVEFRHVERVVGAHHNAVWAKNVYQTSQLVIVNTTVSR
jgi:hypothetical protein